MTNTEEDPQEFVAVFAARNRNENGGVEDMIEKDGSWVDMDSVDASELWAEGALHEMGRFFNP